VEKIDLLVTGVGGQGVILASDIISEAALAAGYDVKKTDTLGMAQRGGSVVSQVRIAAAVRAPLIKEGEADILLAFEKLEAARWSHYLRRGGVAIVNNQAVPPLAVSRGDDRYPTDEEITSIIAQRTDCLYLVEGTRRAKELGNIRTLNIFMLGCISAFMPLETAVWQECIGRQVPPRAVEVNTAAFSRGRQEIGDVHI